MKSVVRIGILALGGAGRAHLRRFAANPKSEVVAIFDPKESAIEQAQRRRKVKTVQLATTDLDAFLSFKGMDAVSVCSPDYCHAPHALAALEHDLHVLIEKPMATSLSECREIIEAAERKQKKVMVHHQMRFVPTFVKSREAVTRNKIGKVFSIEADYYHDARQRAVKYDSWRMDPERGQNIVFGGACHPLDMMQWVANDEIDEVFAYANHLAFKEWPGVDTVVAVLKFRSGIVGKMTKSIGCKRPMYYPMHIFGSEGTLMNGLHLAEAGAEGMTHRSPQRRLWQRLAGRLLAKRRSIIHFPFDHYEHDLACRTLIDGFLDSIQNDSPVPVATSESASVIAVCEAIVKSYETGQPVTVERSRNHDL